MSTTLKQHRNQWTPKFTKNGQIIPSEGIKAITRREMQRQNDLHAFVSQRPQITTPSQRKAIKVKSIAKATLWTLVV